MKLQSIASIFWPVTRKKLHALVAWAGVASAALASVAVWAGMLGIDVTKGKLGAQVAIVLMVAAGWKKAAPKVDAAIDELPIPAGDQPAPVVPIEPTPVTVENPTGGQAAAKGVQKP